MKRQVGLIRVLTILTFKKVNRIQREFANRISEVKAERECQCRKECCIFSTPAARVVVEFEFLSVFNVFSFVSKFAACWRSLTMSWTSIQLFYVLQYV